MLLRRKKSKAQSTLEYAVVIACVAGALIAMSIYVKRGLSGRFRQSADELGPQHNPADTSGHLETTVYSHTITNSTSTNEAAANKDINKDNLISSDVYFTEIKSDLKYENIKQSGDETVGPLGKDLF